MSYNFFFSVGRNSSKIFARFSTFVLQWLCPALNILLFSYSLQSSEYLLKIKKNNAQGKLAYTNKFEWEKFKRKTIEKNWIMNLF